MVSINLIPMNEGESVSDVLASLKMVLEPDTGPSRASNRVPRPTRRARKKLAGKGTIDANPSKEAVNRRHELNELISESEVLRLRQALARAHLRAARKAGIIRWTKGKRGSAWYRLTDVDAFIQNNRELQCHNPASDRSLSWEGSGSHTTPTAECSDDSGLSPELEEHVAQALAQQI